MRRYILTITCPDRVGIVAAVTSLIAGRGGSVLEAAQHGDLASNRFFLRIEIVAESLPAGFGPDELATAFELVAAEFDMEWKLSDTDEPKRVVLFASKEDHCVADLLYRWRSGELECDVACVISNHEDLRGLVEWHGVPFRCVPVGSEPAAKEAAFEEIEKILGEERAEVIVLARYMQILPASFCAGREGRIINIHHSFLPSFAGARPYHQAFDRGVKLIGATCHYVTAELDEGPIIEQDTRRIDHGDSVAELQRVGRDVERTVLAQGLRWHLEDRVLLNGNKTVVFQ
ncbi:MAG TPA: formyltetrahydrofolate deformylase [Acidimicrobiales bacterium]